MCHLEHVPRRISIARVFLCVQLTASQFSGRGGEYLGQCVYVSPRHLTELMVRTSPVMCLSVCLSVSPSVKVSVWLAGSLCTLNFTERVWTLQGLWVQTPCGVVFYANGIHGHRLLMGRYEKVTISSCWKWDILQLPRLSNCLSVCVER